MNTWTFARLALAFLWLATAVVSISSGRQIGYDVLASSGIVGPLAELCLYGGAALDLLLGLWMLSSWKRLLCLRLQVGVVLLYSLLLTLIESGFWGHPFGPLTKNLPVLALILLLHQQESKTTG